MFLFAGTATFGLTAVELQHGLLLNRSIKLLLSLNRNSRIID